MLIGNMSELYRYHFIEIDRIAHRLATMLASVDVMTFTGSLGAGKTTMVRHMLAQYGVADLVTSPTFAYVNIYHDAQGNPLYHFDLYRIQTVADFLSMGFNEYLYQPGAKVIVEWPEPIKPLLTHAVAVVDIEYGADEEVRVLTVVTY